MKDKVLTAIYQVLAVAALIVAAAFGVEARVSGQMEKLYVNKVDYVQSREELKQRLLLMDQRLQYIQKRVGKSECRREVH